MTESILGEYLPETGRLTKVLIVDDTAFSASQKARNLNTIKMKYQHHILESDIVIYVTSQGSARLLKGTRVNINSLMNLLA